MQKIVIIGPAHPLRGGLASFDERLARAFQQQGDQVTIYTFSLQYPGFIFPGTTQYSTEPAPTDINIKVCINSINPVNWMIVGNELKKICPNIIIVRYWLPLMGPCLGTILRRVKANNYTKVVTIADNIIPHEKRPGDKPFTQYFIKPVDAFITMSEKVMNDLRTFTSKPAKQIVHPLYDNFGEQVNKATARAHLKINTEEPVILFFGFIRKYKGLDLLLEAMKLISKNQTSDIRHPKLLIAGEFYEDRKTYDELIQNLNIADQLILHTDFIADSEVKYYLSAADFVIQPYRNATQSGVTPLAYHFEKPMLVTNVGYRNATQSGVTPLAYHFEKPMLVTNVGGLPDLVPDGKAGLVCEPDAASIAAGILKLYQLGEDYFLPHLREEKKKYSWDILVNTIKDLAK